MSNEQNQRNRVWLLRCWQEGEVGSYQEPSWRFSVEEVYGERRRQGFGCLDELVAFLRSELVIVDGKRSPRRCAMLRRMLWILLLVTTCAVACSPATRDDVSTSAGSAAGTIRDAAPGGPETTTIDSVWPDHGTAGDLVTIMGSGFGLDPRGIRVRIGGAPVEVVDLGETGDGYQWMEVELNEGTASGPVSVYAADQWTTAAGAFCAQPVIHGLTLARGVEEATVLLSGSNIDPSALVYVGEEARRPQRLRSARRPHRSEPTQLFIAVRPDDHGTLWVENRCPDGRRYAATSTTTFGKSIGN